MPMHLARRAVLALALAAGVTGLAGAPLRAEDAPVTIFAAASMKGPLDAVAAKWKAETGKATTISYAASSALAKQIEQGAPADLFLSADLDWMDYVAGKQLIKPETRVSLLANRIVLIGPSDSTAKITLTGGVDLSTTLGSGKLAMGNVDSVPAGKYGKAALEKLGGWDKVKDKVAQADNVRAALLLVARGEAPLGIVYATDAAAEPKVKIVATFPEETHPPIIYPVAVLKDSANPDALSFLSYLRGAGPKATFEKQGFTVLNKPASAS